jgi:hypothetical protein
MSLATTQRFDGPNLALEKTKWTMTWYFEVERGRQATHRRNKHF